MFLESCVRGRVSEDKAVGAITHLFGSSIPGPNLWGPLCNFRGDTEVDIIMGNSTQSAKLGDTTQVAYCTAIFSTLLAYPPQGSLRHL